MRNYKLCAITVLLLLTMASGVTAQKSKGKPVAQKAKSAAEKNNTASAQDEQKVKDIVAFLEFMLNTLGSSATSARDKDVLITESYSKIFRDGKVQVEDDLDEERNVITNKDVVAYLKDVDFFFNDVRFEFTIEDINESTMANGQLFYRVSLTRNLTGTTAEGKPVNNTMPRYIEINYNPEIQELKIVSIYTNEFDETEALTNWWKELSYEWQSIFKRKLDLTDSVTLSDIKNITAIEELDLSNNTYIQTIEPLAQLISLKLLNLSEANVNDLTPIRNLTELVELNVSNTNVHDLTPLKYSTNLARLNINHTKVKDISVVEKMPELQNLEMRGTPVAAFEAVTNLTGLLNLDVRSTKIANLSPLDSLVQLRELDISGTQVTELHPLKELKNLIVLTLDSTRVREITVLSGLDSLKVLHANHTLIATLQPLQNLTHLERIYCDQTNITSDKADAFMAANPDVLVIFDSKDLKAWWDTLSPEWQDVLNKAGGFGATPSKEALAGVTNLDSINFGGNPSITDLEPLRRLQKLQVIIANKTGIHDLSPIRDHKEIRLLDISETEVNDLSVVRTFTKLKALHADHTKIQDIEPVYNIAELEELYVDQTFVQDSIAREFLEKNPRCLIVYKTGHLNRWWADLPENWKEVFRVQMGIDTSATRANLHKLVEREALHFKEARVNDLSVLSEFVRLKELHFSATAIRSIPPLDNLTSLRSLRATNSPIQNIESLKLLTDLEHLDISNTPVDDLKPLSHLQNLKTLNCPGTQIRKLDPLEELENLEHLDCSNTRTKKLNPLTSLSLKTLKCYNTKISKREVEKFRDRNPECEVVYYR